MTDISNSSISISIYLNKKNNQMSINPSIKISKLKESVYTQFQLDATKYSMFYKSIKLSLDDNRPLYKIIGQERHPSFFLISKEDLKNQGQDSSTITIYTKLNEKNFNCILQEFFNYKSLEYNVQIKTKTKGVFILSFANKDIANSFKDYYNTKINLTKEKLWPLETVPSNSRKYNTNKNKSVCLPRLDHNSSEVGFIKVNVKNFSTISRSNIKKKILDKASEELDKSLNKGHKRTMKFSNSTVSVRLPTIHDNKSRCESVLKNKYNYYMSEEERYNLNRLFDKKNWVSKESFVTSVGKYSMKNRYNVIDNYVSLTPSVSPLLYNYRDVNKSKWITKNGIV